MRAGSLRHTVTIQRIAGYEQDTTGQKKPLFVDEITVKAEVITAAGTEVFRGDAIRAETTEVVSIRYRPGIMTDKRLIWDGKFLNIISVVDEDNRHRRLNIQTVREG